MDERVPGESEGLEADETPLYDDQRLYTVKEAARILGLNEKSLRYYDEVGLIRPFFRDEENRYRYYTINQFYQIESFKFAKRLGLSLSHYRDLLMSPAEVERGDCSRVSETLEELLAKKETQMAELRHVIDEIRWQQECVRILQANRMDGKPFKRELPERYVYFVEHDQGEPFETTSAKMRSTRGKWAGHLTERYGLLLDVGAAFEGRQLILRQYVVLESVTEEGPDVMRLPGGAYTCVLYHAMRPSEPLRSLAGWLRAHPEQVTGIPWLVADEVGFFESVPEIVHTVGLRTGV